MSLEIISNIYRIVGFKWKTMNLENNDDLRLIFRHLQDGHTIMTWEFERKFESE